MSCVTAEFKFLIFKLLILNPFPFVGKVVGRN